MLDLLFLCFICRFPKAESILKEWLRVIPTVKEVKSNLRVCHTHFDKSNYYRSANKLILKKTAIPNIFPRPILMNITNCEKILAQNTAESCIMSENTISVDNIIVESNSKRDNNTISVDKFLSDEPLQKKQINEKEVQVSPDMKVN